MRTDSVQSNLGILLDTGIEKGKSNAKFKEYHGRLCDQESEWLLGLGVMGFMSGERVPSYVVFAAALAEAFDQRTISLMAKRDPPRKLRYAGDPNVGDYERDPSHYVAVDASMLKPSICRAAGA